MNCIKNFTYNAYVAMMCGVNAATIFRSIAFYQEFNQKNDRNFHEGRYWVYNSKKAWAELYPHFTEKQIRTALDVLEEEGLIISSNKFNANPFDRTKWYSLTQKALEYTERLDLKIPGGRSDQGVQSDWTTKSNDARDYGINTINTVNKPDKAYVNACARERIYSLNKPNSIKEVIEEAGKRRCVINEQQAQDFYDKYEAVSENGTWVSGKNVVTDWRKLITSGWIKGWQREFREGMASQRESGRLTQEEFQAEIAAERAALGLS